MPTSDVEDDQYQSASPADSGNEQDLEMTDQADMKNENSASKNGGNASNAKDPNRPRRKKARRACYACQRAHLTCGDERPCQRCIKRGLEDVCQDGVRKKAKYLHDAPIEALWPGASNNTVHAEFKRSDSSSQPELRRTTSNTQSDLQPSTPFFSPTYNVFNQNVQMPPPSLHERSMSTVSYNQSSPLNTAFTFPGSRSMQSSTVTQDPPNPALTTTGWASTLFDPADASMFNIDIASMNFESNYGALEFGMLGHMATGAAETPDSENGTQRGSIGQYPLSIGNFSESPQNHTQFPYSGDALMGGGDWTNGSSIYGVRRHGPNAYAIETNPAHFTSPEATHTPPDAVNFDKSPVLKHRSSDVPRSYLELATAQENGRAPAQITTPQLKKSQLPVKPAKRPRDPSSVYTSVTHPYPYTVAFHQLIAYLQRRFSNAPSKTLAIAKSLASIRPSFIATTKTLNREDLIFMEKCLQRTLWEYEGFIEGVGTPTIVARRTGEIAAVGKEFQILTGWTKNVLLGRSPNLNVNRGHSGKTPAESGANSTGRVTGATTPLRGVNDDDAGNKQQPVFLAELLDDDTIVRFYEDFARLAFGDSRGSVMGKGKLLKYRTKDDEIAANLRAEVEARNEIGERSTRPELKRIDSFAATRPQDAKKGISGEKGMQKLGSSDGKVDCAYCWTVKRDVFDIPMLIVMNFLPCI